MRGFSANLVLAMASVSLLGLVTQSVAAPLSPQIIGGKPAKAETFGWQVAMVASQDMPGRAKGQLMCGGVLVSPIHVLTAAHCIDRNGGGDGLQKPFDRHDAVNISILVGATNFTRPGDGDLVPAKSLTAHPLWKASSNRVDHDIAMIELTRPVRKGVPIKVRRRPVGTEMGRAWVSGWGLTEMQQLSTTLRAADVPIVDPAACAVGNHYGASLTANMLCAGLREGGKDSCSGDSGGPLVIGRLGAVQLVGIVSWGHGCALPNRYGVYARVSQMLEFIEATGGGQVIFTSADPGVLFEIPNEGEI